MSGLVPRRTPPTRRLVALGVVLTCAVGLVVWMINRRAQGVLPIPVPKDLARLDPQVREHLTRLAKAVAESPRDSAARTDLGLAFAVNGLWNEARQSLLDAATLGEPGPLPGLHAAAALQEAGSVQESLREVEELVARFSTHAPTWHRLGTLRGAVGRWDAAEQAFLQATKLSPEAWQAWAGLGEALLRQGRGADAVAPLQRALALDPFARSARHLLGQALRAAGRHAEADRYLATSRTESVGPMPDEWSERAAGHMRTLPDLFERADAWVAGGRAVEAVALLRGALKFHPGNSAVLSRLAAALRASDQPGAAWELISVRATQATNDVTLLVAAIHTAAALERFDWARPWVARALELTPHSAEVRVAAADVALAEGDDPRAVALLREATERAPSDAGLWVQLGDVLRFNLSRPAEALDCYRRALAADAIHPVALERWASLCLERGDLESADKAVRELRELRVDRATLDPLEESLAQARDKKR